MPERWGWSPCLLLLRRRLLLLSLLLLAVEALNTAIEVLCDHVTPEIHPMIKKAKDLGSAAIFIVGSAMALVLVLTVADLIRK